MQLNATGLLPLSKKLSERAQTAHVLDDLQAPLLSMGQLCDDKCQVVLTEKEMHVFKNNAIILKGKRNFRDGLWDVPLPLNLKLTTPVNMAHFSSTLPNNSSFNTKPTSSYAKIKQN